ncbi:MAG: hypothetical protein K6U10_13100, partial [Acidobacteriia bacterium]|nr:hypothetical protein [Terriglobia bacterium]
QSPAATRTAPERGVKGHAASTAPIDPDQSRQPNTAIEKAPNEGERSARGGLSAGNSKEIRP